MRTADATQALTGEVHPLMNELGRRGYLIYTFQLDQHGPEVVAGVLKWIDYVDVLVLRSDRRADAWRAVRRVDEDALDPTQVAWWCGGGPSRVLGDLLTLPDPGQPLAPTFLMGTPPGVGLPSERRGAPLKVRRRGT